MTANVQIQQILIKRGNSAQISNYTGPIGEPIYNTETKTLHMQDGAAAGGSRLATYQDVANVAANVANIQANTSSLYGNANVAVYLSSGSVNTIIAANLRQTSGTVALGYNTGATAQGTNAIAIGNAAGSDTQGSLAVAIGSLSGQTAQGSEAVAVGRYAGRTNQGAGATALGRGAGNDGQGANAVAVGYMAGWSNQTTNSIILNATGSQLNSSQSGFFVAPVRNVSTSNVVFYDTTTKELTYGAAPATYGNANVAAYLPTYTGNIAGNISKNDKTWTFGTDGTLTIPNGGKLGGLQYADGIDLYADGGMSYAQVNYNNNNYIYVDTNVSALQTTNALVTADTLNKIVTIQVANPDLSQDNTWTFRANGTLTLPNAGLIEDPTGTSQVVLTENTFRFESNVGTDSTYIEGQQGALFLLGGLQGTVIGAGANTWQFNADGTTTFPDHGDVTMTGNLTVGNLSVNGNVTYINTQSYSVVDNIIQMADGNPADSLDIGFVGHRTVNSTLQHTGLVRHASSNQWRLFSNVIPSPGNTVDFTNAIYDTLQIGDLTAANTSLYSVNFTASPVGSSAPGIQWHNGFQDGIYGNTQVATYLPTYTGNVSGISFANGNLNLGAIQSPVSQAGTLLNVKGIVGMTASSGANISGFSTISAATLSAGTFTFSNGVNIFSTIAASSSYSNVNVAAYIPTDPTFTAFQANVGSFYTYANATYTGGGGTTYTNANVISMLAANTAVFIGNVGNVSTVYPLQSNVTQVFVSNSTALTSGGGGNAGTTYLLNNVYFGANGASFYRNTQTGAAWITMSGSGGITFAGTSGAVTANAVQGMGSWASLSATGFATQNSVGITSAGTLAVNGSGGITTTQTTIPVLNATATTINFGNAATSINMGAASGTVAVAGILSAGGNVFATGNLGVNSGNLTLRSQGTWNTALSINSNGGFNSPPYTNQAVIGGSGTGMTATYSSTGGYLTTMTIVSPGTGYRNGDVLSVPGGIAGNSFVLANYNSNVTGSGASNWVFTMDGNLILPINANILYANGVNALYGNTQANSLLSSGIVSSITATGNITAGNVVTTGTYVVANITTTGAYGNITGANVVSANTVTVSNGIFWANGTAWSSSSGGTTYSNANVVANLQNYVTNISTTANITTTANIIAPNYLFANGVSILSGLGGSTSSLNNGTANVFLAADNSIQFPDGIILAPGSQAITMQSNSYSQLMWTNSDQSAGTNKPTNTDFYVESNNATLDIGYKDGSGNQAYKTWYWSVDGSYTLPGDLNMPGLSTIAFTASPGGAITGASIINTANLAVSYGIIFPDDTIQTTSYANANVAAYLVANPQSGTYSNANVVANLRNLVTNISSTANIATTANVIAPNYLFANGVNILSTIVATSSYSNANVTAYLTAGNIAVGNVGYTVLPNIVAQFTSNVNSYGQINAQNINNGTAATTEIVATANNGTDTIFFIDMGIAGNTYNVNAPNNSLGNVIYANDSYVYAQGNTIANIGGNLALGATTPGRAVTIFAGGINNTSNVATFANTGVTVYANLTAANIITTGATSGNISGANWISANTFQVTNGIFWSNGTAWSSAGGSGSSISNGSSSLTFASSGSNGVFQIAGVQTATFSQTAISMIGNISATANITAANIIANQYGNSVGTTATYTGNVTAANVIANQYGNSVGTTATYTGNVTAANIVTTGTYGNITNANVISANNISLSGYGVTMPSRPAFRVNGTGSTPVNVGATLKGATITTLYNQGNYFNSTTGLFTAPVAGIYMVGLNARVGTNNSTNQIAVLKNGLNTGGNIVCFWESDTNTGTATHFGVNGTIQLSVGDWLSANVLLGNVQFDSNDNWTVTYIG